jgi:hypothetical protein
MYSNPIAVPTIPEIQETLVTMGDKEAVFVGSKTWIGATELGFLLDELMGYVPFGAVASGSENKFYWRNH